MCCGSPAASGADALAEGELCKDCSPSSAHLTGEHVALSVWLRSRQLTVLFFPCPSASPVCRSPLKDCRRISHVWERLQDCLLVLQPQVPEDNLEKKVLCGFYN